jgi:flagellar basal body-associated protein FliL
VAAGFSWFKSRTWPQRFSILLAFAFVGALILVVAKMYQGKLLPKTEREWIASFEEKADGVFTYERTDPFEDFNDPILHPEFVVVIERVIVNLARTPEAEEGSNPMAAFEFYIQTDNQESAIEVKDRNIEIRDVLARAVERMTYPELATEDGKQKLKLVLRKDLNLIMTKGRVRRVFLKTIVLNPE